MPLFEFLARELNAHFLFMYIVNVYKSIHKRQHIAFTHLRELHMQRLSHHYIPTSAAKPLLAAWLGGYQKLSQKMMSLIAYHEAYPATTIPFVKPVLRNNMFTLEYNQMRVTVAAPPALISAVHSHINNSVWLAHLQFICALRLHMAGDRSEMKKPGYFAIRGPFFSAHPDLTQLLSAFRVGQTVDVCWDTTN